MFSMFEVDWDVLTKEKEEESCFYPQENSGKFPIRAFRLLITPPDNLKEDYILTSQTHPPITCVRRLNNTNTVRG